MSLTEILLLLFLPVLLAGSAFFSGSETALFTLSRHQRLQLARSNAVGAAAIARLLADTRSTLVTVLLGNMTINVLFFIVATVLLLRFEQRPTTPGWVVAVASIAPLLAMIVFGEVMPKVIAARTSMTWTRLVALPVLLIHRLLTPVRVFVSVAVITPLARLIIPERSGPELSPQELETLLELSQQRGVIDRDEEQLLQQVLEMGQLKVRDIMTPRVDMVAYNLNSGPAALYELMRESRISKIPVYRGDLDHIEGIIYARQVLLRRPKTAQEVIQLVRQVTFVPELQRADQLLIHLRKTGTLLVIAVDEYGGTAGLATIRDVVEHVVGPINDPEEPVRPPEIQTVAPGQWQVSADLPVREWLDLLGVTDQWLRQVGAAGVSTVGGLVMARLGRLPRVGDRAVIGNLVMQVERMDGRKIDRLLIHLGGQVDEQSSAREAQP